VYIGGAVAALQNECLQALPNPVMARSLDTLRDGEVSAGMPVHLAGGDSPRHLDQEIRKRDDFVIAVTQGNVNS
jgi:hypothetical protein